MVFALYCDCYPGRSVPTVRKNVSYEGYQDFTSAEKPILGRAKVLGYSAVSSKRNYSCKTDCLEQWHDTRTYGIVVTGWNGVIWRSKEEMLSNCKYSTNGVTLEFIFFELPMLLQIWLHSQPGSVPVLGAASASSLEVMPCDQVSTAMDMLKDLISRYRSDSHCLLCSHVSNSNRDIQPVRIARSVLTGGRYYLLSHHPSSLHLCSVWRLNRYSQSGNKSTIRASPGDRCGLLVPTLHDCKSKLDPH